MKTIPYLIGFGLLLTGCSGTRITSTPYAGYRMHEHLVITPVADLREVENDRMMTAAIELLSKELIFLNIIPYQDAVYKASQYGVVLPAYNRYDTAQLGVLHRKANIQYILAGDLVQVRSEDFDTNSPYYKAHEATLSFQLLDAIHKTIVWRCTVRFTAKPLQLGKDKENSYNLRSEDFAIHKAYQKGMKRLAKNFELIPNRPKVKPDPEH